MSWLNRRLTRADSLSTKAADHESNPATTSRCATQSVRNGFRCNHSRLMHRGFCPARMAWMKVTQEVVGAGIVGGSWLITYSRVLNVQGSINSISQPS